MFCLRTAILNAKRHKSKSILVTLTYMVIVVFLFIYMDSIQTNQKQLLALPQALPVTAKIENANGSQETGLEIPENTVSQIISPGYAKDMLCTTLMAADFSATPDQGNVMKEISILGANDINAIPNRQGRQIKLMDGVTTDFLHGKDAACLAGDAFLQQHHLSIGDTVSLKLFTLKYDQFGSSFIYQPLGDCSLRIVGSVSPPQGVLTPENIDLVCPVAWAQGMHVRAGAVFNFDSVSFTVADPLKLDAFKAAMKPYLSSASPLAGSTCLGAALLVKDEIFIKTASRIKKNLNVLYSFSTVIFVVIALIGYAMAYLLMQSRRADIATMRSLGTSRRGCVAIMLIEYAILGLAGSMLGIICTAIWAGVAWSTLWVSLLFLASMLLGVLAAVWQISKLNTMTGLIKTES